MEDMLLTVMTEGVGYHFEKGGLAWKVCIPQSHPWSVHFHCCLTPGAWLSLIN